MCIRDSAQAAALAAVSVTGYLHKVITQVTDGRNRIAGIASVNGLASLPSAANFVAIDCGQDGTYAIAVLNDLVRQGVFVRMPGVAPLNRCIRVTASLNQHLNAFSEALPGALASAKSAS